MTLTEFVVKGWRRDNYKYRTKLTGEIIFVTCESGCYEITSQAASTIEERNSTQKDADARRILHAANAARSGCNSVVVASEDTDIFLLCLAFKCFIQHPCMSRVERRQELDMPVSPVHGGSRRRRMLQMPNWYARFHYCECLSYYRTGDAGVGSIRYAFSEPSRVYLLALLLSTRN